MRYTTRQDMGRQVCNILIVPLDGDTALGLRTGRARRWLNETTVPLAHLDGCQSIARSCTPFTGALGVRQFALAPGQTAELAIIPITTPAMHLGPVQQCCTCIASPPGGSHCRYRSLGTGLGGEFSVDHDGLVIGVASAFSRIWPL